MKQKAFICFVVLMLVCSIQSQTDSGPFKTLWNKQGVVVSFIFYSDGNGAENNGVVIMLQNKNDYTVMYNFTLVFRTTVSEKEQFVSGSLKPFEKITGSDNGLFFIPYTDNRSIIEVGIRNCTIRKLDNS